MPVKTNRVNSPAPRKILVIDDDDELRRLLASYLNKHGFDTWLLPDARQLEAYLERHRPHLIVLDLMLPGEDGLSVCQRLRGRGEDIPIIMLTARDETVDRIVGLTMGADDYLGKPFDPRELIARIEAVLRRHKTLPAAPDPEAESVAFGDFVLDREARCLRHDGQTIPLSSGEFALLQAFVNHPFKPLRRDRLLELIHGPDTESFDRSIDVQVLRLRRLIEPDPKAPRYIQTIWGFGYVFVPTGETGGMK